VITWADVLAFAPALSAVTPAAQVFILAHVDRALSPSWGDDRPIASIYLAAHIATLQQRAAALGTNASGPVSSETEGGLSASYGSNWGAGGHLSLGGYESTPWGLLYLELVRTSFARGPMVL
jgi:hypothetical protein